jgi:hypothetical protein
MRKKYTVASRRIVFKRFGIPGYPLSLGPLAATTIIKNARRSGYDVTTFSELRWFRRFEVRGRTERNRNNDKTVHPRSPLLEKADSEWVQIDLR